MAGILGAVGKVAGGFISSTIARLTGAGLNKGADSPLNSSAEARWGGKDAEKDFRAKLLIPSNSGLRKEILENRLMSPLQDIGGIVFPLSPSILLNHTAHYNMMASTHNNYPFYAYQNSEAQNFTCIGDFPVQNYEDARAWVATLHFLRTVTKMFFGGGAYKGSPPPVLKFSAYGDYVFSNVPVVVTNFSVELTAGVDYISTKQTEFNAQGIDRGLGDGIDDDIVINANTDISNSASWAPAMSLFTVQLQPIYSRKSLSRFSMEKFASGDKTLNSNDPGGNGYTFI